MSLFLLVSQLAFAGTPHDSTSIVLAGRSVGALPVGAIGAVGAYSADVGIEWKNGHALALRMTFVNQPPPMFYAEADWGAGPVVAWSKHFRANERFDLSLGAATGLLAGPDAYTGANTVMPMLQVSGGARVLVGPLDKAPMFVEGDICAVVTLLAPCAAVSVGVMLPS